MKILAAIVQVAMRIYYGLVYPVRIIGGENSPAEGGFLLCPNHISARDPMVIMMHVRRKVRFMAKKELFDNWLIGGLLRAVGAFPVARGQADLGAIREGVKTLKAGDGLGIFPQGTRSADNEHLQMHNGTALLTQQTGAPVIPVFIDGPYRKFHVTNIYIGKPLNLSEYAGKRDSETLARITECVDRGIWSLKPEK